MQPGAFMEPQHMNLLQGLSAFPITPADEHGIVDTDALGGLVHRLGQAEVNSICVLGSTGTYAYLSRQERQRAIRAALDQAGTTPVMAGIGALRSDEVLALGRSEEHTSELQSLMRNSYAVFCLKKKNTI